MATVHQIQAKLATFGVQRHRVRGPYCPGIALIPPRPSALGTLSGLVVTKETTMRKFLLSVSGLSIVLALGLALWEWYFFFVAGTHTPNRLGFNLAWLVGGYLTYQLISIPFALPAARDRFIGVVDGMVSLVPLAVVLVVVFGKSDLLRTPERWEAAILLLCMNAADLFGGYAFNIALSRRIFDVSSAPSSS
jgi:hypothetical protein